MKNLHTAATLFLLVFLSSCAKEEPILQSGEMAPLFQHWALEYEKETVSGTPFSIQFPDAIEMTEGYEFFSNGKGYDYGHVPKALFTYEITKSGTDKIIVITKSIPTIQVATGNGNHNFEGGCSNNFSNGSGCNNTENFNAAQQQSVVYQTKTESFRIVYLDQTSLQGFLMN